MKNMWQKLNNNTRPGILLLSVGMSCMITAGSLMATVASGFRVTPYVQNPSQDAVTLVWGIGGAWLYKDTIISTER